MSAPSNAGAAAFGLLLDRLLGEPPTMVHPVAWFGTAMGRLEGVIWSDRRSNGVLYAACGTGIGLAAGRLVGSTTAAVAIAAAGRALRSTAADVVQIVERDDLDTARHELRALVGRDASVLDASGIAAAAIESLAENSVDAVIAPAFWGVMAGAPGALAYRAVNTMDAMVGHRSQRYRRFGTAAARLDDVANYVPARLFALGVAAVQPGRAGRILYIVRRDAGAHPSPNAGVAESAVAAAVGLQLGGPLRYGERTEQRPTLGDGPRPQPGDVASAISLVDRVERLAVGICVGFWLLRAWR